MIEPGITKKEFQWALCFLGYEHKDCMSFLAFKIEMGGNLGIALNYVSKVIGRSIPETYREAIELIRQHKRINQKFHRP